MSYPTFKFNIVMVVKGASRGACGSDACVHWPLELLFPPQPGTVFLLPDDREITIEAGRLTFTVKDETFSIWETDDEDFPRSPEAVAARVAEYVADGWKPGWGDE